MREQDLAMRGSRPAIVYAPMKLELGSIDGDAGQPGGPGGHRSLQLVTTAPVTYVPCDGSNPVSSRSQGGVANCFSGLMRRMSAVAASIALGAALVLSSGCATRHAGMGLGVPSVGVGVAISPSAYDIRVDDPAVQRTVAAMEESIRGAATPVMQFVTHSPYLRQTVQASYDKNIIPEFELDARAGGEAIGVFLPPVSGHVGDTYAETQANADHYGEIDRHKVWTVGPDGKITVLVDNFDPQGQWVSPIKLHLKLQPGKNMLMWSPLPNGRPELKCHDHSFAVDPYGFGPGRIQIIHVK